MDIRKAAEAGAEHRPVEQDLALINRWSRRELMEDEVYTFSVRLCDNEVDRDGERFSAGALEELAALFVGKSGIFDHQWSARGQAARIYRTEVVEEKGLRTEAGDGYRYLKGWAYMLRTEANRDLIAEIEGGIKREVSVGCAVERAACSICGGDIRDRGACVHEKGKTYGGKLCWAELAGATDAYEWSFVAVPAQKNAGVMKQWKGEGGMDLKEFLGDKPEYRKQMERLEEEAGVGRRYLKGLREEVARLGGLAEPGMDAEMLRDIVDKLGEAELAGLQTCYRKRLEERYPAGVQLPYRAEAGAGSGTDGAFLI